MAHGDHLKYSGKPKAGKKTFLRLISYVACDRRLLIVIGVLIVISIAANLTGSYMLRPIINEYILPGDFQGLVRILLFLAAIYLTGVAATYIEYILLNKIGQRTVTRMREELFGKMERLPVRYFDTHQHGDVMSRYTNDIDRISDALTDSLSDMLSSALTVIGIFCLMIFISPILTAVTLITVPLMFLSAKGIVKRSRKYFKAQQEALGMMNGYAEEMISGQKVVKVFGHEQKVETDFGILNQSLKDKSLKAQFYSGLMMPVMQNLNTLNYVIITIVGALLAIFRGFDVGGLAAFLQYSRQFGRPINELASLYNSIQAAIAGAERIFEIIDEAPEKADVPEAVTLKNIKGDVALKLPSGENHLERSVPACTGRKENSPGRRHRSRKDNDIKPASPLFRYSVGRDHHRQSPDRPDRAQQPSPFNGYRVTGHPSLHRYGTGEHPLRTPQCDG